MPTLCPRCVRAANRLRPRRAPATARHAERRAGEHFNANVAKLDDGIGHRCLRERDDLRPRQGPPHATRYRVQIRRLVAALEMRPPVLHERRPHLHCHAKAARRVSNEIRGRLQRALKRSDHQHDRRTQRRRAVGHGPVDADRNEPAAGRRAFRRFADGRAGADHGLGAGRGSVQHGVVYSPHHLGMPRPANTINQRGP